MGTHRSQKALSHEARSGIQLGLVSSFSASLHVHPTHKELHL